MDGGRDQPGGAAHFYRQIEAGSAEALNGAIPGARFDWIADSGPAFTARFTHLLLDGIVLCTLGLDQASYLTLGERVRDFNIWHAIGPLGEANGSALHEEDLLLVRPGEGGTLRTRAAVVAHSFALLPVLAAQAAELELPLGPFAAPRPGRWHLTSRAAGQRLMALHQAVLEQVGAAPSVLERPLVRAALHNALLEAIAALGPAGGFQPDRAAAGRHTRIMLRFEQIVREAAGEPLSMLEICRRTGASRRALAAIVLARTGKGPLEYMRWRRLWRARALLSRPDAGATVTEIAFGLGFWHLGRFAAAYAAAFGERPSLTLARALGRPAQAANFAQIG